MLGKTVYTVLKDWRTNKYICCPAKVVKHFNGKIHEFKTMGKSPNGKLMPNYFLTSELGKTVFFNRTGAARAATRLNL